MRKLVFALAQLLISTTVFALDTIGFEKNTYVSSASDTLHYRFLRPEIEKAGEKYPLVLFLHGAGERGSDNELQLTHGAQMWLNPVNRQTYPAFVLFPQCPADGYWAYTERPQSFVPVEMPVPDAPAPIETAVKELLDSIMTMPQVDTDRIYVIGLSMGGMATFDMTVRYPEVFAAAVPICGSVNPARLQAAKDVNFRIYHGDADTVVPVDGSRQAYRALQDAGARVVYIEYPGVTHGSWHNAFNDPDFMKWLFGQSK